MDEDRIRDRSANPRLIGSYERRVDGQRRLSIPNRLAYELSSAAKYGVGALYISKSKFHGAAYLVPGEDIRDAFFEESKFDKALRVVDSEDRSMSEVLANTFQIKMRDGGRISLPSEIYEYLGRPDIVKIVGIGVACYILPSPRSKPHEGG